VTNRESSVHGVYVVSGLAYMLVAHEAAVRICLDTPKLICICKKEVIMNLQFKSLGDHRIVNDVFGYINTIIKNKPEIKIYVGTDSQNGRRMTTYATVIVMHFNENDSGKGAHVLYSKEHLPKLRDRFTRLWGEVERSVEVSNMLRDGGITVKNIDLDFNEDPKYNSNTVLRSAVGYVESSGFVARWKPYNAFSCRVADILCK
jgi:predicted RNase H-related nuclease YkuK (DUF458 family)